MTFERNIKEGIAYTTLYYIESGRIKNARADQLVKICLTLGCTPEEFLYIAGYPQK
jgi:DNA-binding Xre family transcriptional regulator